MSDADDDRPAPPRTDGPPPVLSRPLEDEVRDPFGPVGPPPAPRRPAEVPAPSPSPPARSLLGRSPDASPLLDGAASPPPAPAPPPPARSLLGRSPDASLLLDGAASPLPPLPPPPAVPLAPAPISPPPPGSPFAPVGGPPAGSPPPPVPAPPPPGESPSTPPTGPLPGSLGSPTGSPTEDGPRSLLGGASSLFSPPGGDGAAPGPPPPSPVETAPPPPPPMAAPVPGGGPTAGSPWAPGPPPGDPQTGWPPPAGWPSDAPWPPLGPRSAGSPPAGSAPPIDPPPGAPWPPAGPPPAGPAFPFLPPDPPASGIGPWTLAALGVAVLVVVASVVVGLGTLRGGSTESAETVERTYPSAWDARVAPIAEWVADERDLAFAHPVEVVFQPEEEYVDQAAGDPTDLDEEEQQDMDDLVATLRALGLVDGEVDLAEATGDLAGEGTLAYYDPATEVVHVRGDELTPAVRVTVAHELTHVLQDQHFDLERLGDPDFDRYEGLRAMAEGDAGRIEDAYVAEVLTTEERTAYEDETEASIDGSEAALEGVPPVLSVLFGAPYALGEGFLAYREGADGGQPWDAVLEDPPSQEELLDPSAWETPRAEEVHVEVDAPEGVDILEKDSFDPLSWYLLLASRGDPVDALRVVDGWGGDAYVSYREDDEVCVAMTVTGDDPAATDALHEALVAWAGADPAGTAEVARADDTVEVRACDPGADAGTAGGVSEALLVVPVVRAQLAAQVLAGGGTEEQAECTGWAVVEALTLDQLAAPTLDAATEQQITQAITGCA